MTNLTMLPTTSADAASLYRMSIDDITDRLRVMQHQESTYYRPINYLNHHGNVSPSFKEEHRTSRSAMCEWCHQLTDVTKLSRLAVSRSMNYLDRFVASGHVRARHALVDKREYQLAAMTSLYIAIKLFEPLALDASVLAGISAGCYTTQEIVDMENIILGALEWKINGPTSQEFVCHLLGLLNPSGYGYDINTFASLLDVAKFQCDLATADYALSMCKPSIVAMASILNSIEGVNDETISNRARCVFMAGMCDTMPSLNMAQVRLVQARLRHLFCQNSGEDMSSNNSSNDSSLIKGRDDAKIDTVSCDANCSSPLSVTRSSYLDRRECIAKWS